MFLNDFQKKLMFFMKISMNNVFDCLSVGTVGAPSSSMNTMPEDRLLVSLMAIRISALMMWTAGSALSVSVLRTA